MRIPELRSYSHEETQTVSPGRARVLRLDYNGLTAAKFAKLVDWRGAERPQSSAAAAEPPESPVYSFAWKRETARAKAGMRPKSKKPLLRELLFVLLAAAVTSCSINYREGEMVEELEGTVPNIRMTGLRHRLANKDRLIMEMTAQRSESYESVKRISLSGVNFREYGQEGELVAEGKADTVTYYTDTKNAEIAGNVELLSHREEGGIRTQYLYWDDARRFLSGKPDAETEIFDEDGSSLLGRGFEADIKRLIISFLETVDGNYVTPDDDEDGESQSADEADEAAPAEETSSGVSGNSGG